MRIAFVYDAVYPWHIGGVESVNYNEARELAKGHEVHFFSMRWPGMRSEFTKDRIRYHAYHGTDQQKFYKHGRRSISQAIAFAVNMFRIFSYDFDVVITNQFPVLHLPVLMLYCRIKRCKLVMQVVEVWDKEYWNEYVGWVAGTLSNAYAAFLLHHADLYVANSSTTAGRLRDAGISDGKISVFSPVLEDKEVSGVKANRKRDTIVFSGRFIKEKRIDKWIEIFDRVRKKVDVKGILIGNGPEEGRIRDEIRRRGLVKLISIRDFYRSKKAFYEGIKGCGAMLNMSEREGLSIVTLESLALGTPVFLPAGSPIPREIKEMCIVDVEGKLPARIAGAIRSGNRKRWISHTENLEQFKVSRIKKFYGDLFARLWQ